MSATLGPWKRDGRLVVDARGDAVAMVNIARHVNVAHRDAALIAAAPDLYEALRDLLMVIEVDELIPETVSYMRQARAAIAKAEGKS